jgi:hypothetical protein
MARTRASRLGGIIDQRQQQGLRAGIEILLDQVAGSWLIGRTSTCTG